MRIVISGPAAAHGDDEQQILDPSLLEAIDGLESGDDVCAAYLDEPLNEVGIEGGSLRIVFDRSSKALRVVTEYLAPRKLTKSELSALVEHTKGQWSDGIGEGCFEPYREKTGICVSAFPIPYDDSAVQIQLIEDGLLVRRRSPLFSAAKKGAVKKLQALLEKGEDIEAKGQWEHTPLMWAVGSEQAEAVSFLISRGANVNYKTKSGTTCIKLAAMQGSALILAALMRAGANVNERDEDGMTPVMWAANRGYQDVLQILLDYGADINAQDSRETKTALMWAAPERLHIVEYLLSNGADPKIRTKDGLKASEEALQQATREQQGRPERAKMQESKARFLRPRER